MMLRSLVKKFKSHSLNEDDGQPSSPDATTDDQSGECVQMSPTSSPTIHPSSPTTTTTTMAAAAFSTVSKDCNNQHHPQQHQQHQQHPHRFESPQYVDGMARHHHLRSSVGCGGGGNSNTVSSIATRLRSSVMAAAAASSTTGGGAGVVDQRTSHQQCHQHRQHCQQQQHRRSSGSGGGQARYHGGQASSGSKNNSAAAGLNNNQQDDDYCKDSGTESDDEELERIETNSTHSVPVSQTSDYYASQQSLSINSCRSSHCSSPLLGLSDQECNSWESIGSESGISVRTAGSRHCVHHQKCHPHGGGGGGSSAFRTPAILGAGGIGNNGIGIGGGGGSFQLNACIRPPSEMMMMTEELPQHHYHTRQQFQRLTQQISMKNGLAADYESCKEVAEKDDELVWTPSNDAHHQQQQQPTAFVPVRRQAVTTPIAIGSPPTIGADRSPEGGGSSSLDELEEVNFGGSTHQQQQKSTRRSRSVVPSGGGTSEKRKWSQMRNQASEKQRQQQLPPSNSDVVEKKPASSSSIDQQQQPQRPVLHAARKTPIKLLFSLDEDRRGSSSSRCQLPQHGNVSPPAGNAPKKLRSAKKTCGGGGDGAHRCPKEDDEEEDEDEGNNNNNNNNEEMADSSSTASSSAKRPSLDFNKMRGKLVGLGSTGSRNKKTKRSSSLINCSGMKAKLKAIAGRREGYQLRSTHRQCCLFRPLEPPMAADQSGEMVMTDQPSTSAAAWTSPQMFQSTSWQHQGTGLSGSTFYFGSNSHQPPNDERN